MQENRTVGEGEGKPVQGRIYLDHNATTPLRPRAGDALVSALTLAGNPSSIHAEGRAARAVVEEAREKVAALVGARARDIVFTGGGSEANASALNPGLRRHDDRRTVARLLISAGEHPSALYGHRFGGAVDPLPLAASGLVDLAALDQHLAAIPADMRVVVSVQAANNETGVVQPVAEIARRVRAASGIMHCDAVQAAGRIALSMPALGIDALTLSAHKLGGPKGVGAIALSPAMEMGDRLLAGGGQESGRRAGTENVAGIAAFGIAAEEAAAALNDEAQRLAVLRDAFELRMRAIAPDIVIFGVDVPRLPNTSLFSVPGARAETLLMALDLKGVSVSSGSACSSGKVHRSHVLAAMGVAPELMDCAIRVSFGWTSVQDDITQCISAFESVLRTLSERRPRAA